jgi:uncharacterized Tic20 family protein
MPVNQQNPTEEPIEENNSHWVPEPSPNFGGPLESENSPAAEETKHDQGKVVEPKASHPTSLPVTPNEERTWAMIAHLSVLLNLVTGFFGGIAAIIIYFVYKDRSRLVAYHAMQSFIFQSITWLGAGLLGGIFIGIGSVFAILIIPLLCLVPGFLFLLLIPISLIYGVIGGVQVYNGEDFRYWQVGDWVREILEPKPIS